MGYYQELLDSMIEAGAFGFKKDWEEGLPEWLTDYSKKYFEEHQELFHKDYFDCSLRAYMLDKEAI